MVPGGFVRELHEELVRRETTGFCDCSWGVLASTGAGAGRFVPDYHTEAHFCIYARPDSGITRPEDLADRPLGVSVGTWLLAYGVPREPAGGR